mmetsp:Transcript_69046/g.162458  ORF Transcript_69046/g.162458 Transcript_69046/m.162458 type:complete len:207 (-) Transcript_69046:94-714(-)
MQKRIFVEQSQRKTVYIGQNVLAHPDSIDRETYVADMFYDGKNSAIWASLRIKSMQFTSRFEITRPGTVLEVFAAIGGFASVCLSVLTLLVRLVEGFQAYQRDKAEAKPVAVVTGSVVPKSSSNPSTSQPQPLTTPADIGPSPTPMPMQRQPSSPSMAPTNGEDDDDDDRVLVSDLSPMLPDSGPRDQVDTPTAPTTAPVDPSRLC